MRKLLSVLFSTLHRGVRGGLLFVALLVTTALWAHDFEVDGIYYNYLDGNNVEVTYNSSYSGEVTIPETVTHNGTTYGVTSIGDSAFLYLYSLTSVNIPYGVTRIGKGAFSNCSFLTSINIPNSVTSIGREAFVSCATLSSITIPNSIKSIGYGAFAGCSSFVTITIPNSVESIEELAFSDCSALTSITIPESVTSIGYSAFSGCSSLTSIAIPNSVTSIGESAFERCSALTSIIIPNSLTSIGDRAFYDCSSLTSITIPNSVTSIGESAFWGCNSITSIVVNEDNTIYDSRENCNAIIETATNTLITGCSNTTIPNSVTGIGDYAFNGCKSLTSITIPNSVTSIGYSAFSDCSSLTSVTIGNSVTSIGRFAFSGCSSLTSITIPNSVTSIEKWAFSGCSALTYPVYNANCFVYMPTSFEGDYTIPYGIYQIVGGAFDSCKSLTSITIPNSVTSIGDDAFSYCSSLNSITIPNSVTSIGYRAFSDCSSLTSITIPNSVTSIGGSAFYRCSSLNSITIPNSVTSIGGSAFYRCSSLNSVTIGNSVTSIGDDAFLYCISLTSIIIPYSVTSIGDYAFGWCSSLTSITIPNSVTSIGYDAFYYCSSLTSITCEAETPPTVGSDAFYGVSKSIPVYVPCGCVSAYKVTSGWKAFTNIQELQAEYSIQVSTSNSQMGSAIVVYNTSCGSQISATANDRYHFVQWSDGNTDNPRTLILTQDTVLTAEFALTIAGQCGDNLYWSYDETNQTISITGSGDMYDYTAETQPWLLFKEEIKEVTVANTATSIGTSAFEGCIRLSKISLGTGLKNIAANAFAGCTRLYDIYVYATYPPFAEKSSFANYNVYVYIPCEYQRDYILDVVWGKFKFIECIGAESEDMGGDDVVVTPGTNDVTITWPTEGNADTYTIVIKKGNEVFCTLTFNADGQLLNIAFAPGRDGNRPAQYAEQAGNGYRFTVTGLEEGTHYTYNIDVKNAANKTIKSYTGEFTTESMTAVENTHSQSPMSNCQKIIRDGQLYIYHDDKTYNTVGQIVE